MEDFFGNNFDRRQENSRMQKGENERRVFGERKEHSRLVIDEDSIYEIDLDCMECKERERYDAFHHGNGWEKRQ